MPQRSSNPWRLAHAAMEFAGGPLAGALLGYWIDHTMGTTPWGVLIGSLAGLFAGMGLFILAIVRMGPQGKQAKRREGGDRSGGDRHEGPDR